jgi:hypothetical protein
VLHFSGHGAETGELVFQADDGGSKLVPKEAIVATISTAAASGIESQLSYSS